MYIFVYTEPISVIGLVFEAPNYASSSNQMYIDRNVVVERPGVIFGYRAYIANRNNMVVLQLWRPVSGLLLRLIDVFHYSPTEEGKVVDVSPITLSKSVRLCRLMQVNGDV